MHLMLASLYKARWSDEIHEEWMSAVLKQRPDLKREQLERTRTLMGRIGVDSPVSGHEEMAGKIKNLPDPGDAHVIAAAIKDKADTILTYNSKDFPARVLEPLGIRAMTPDAFICELLGKDSALDCATMLRHRECLKKPPNSAEEHLETLAQQKLTKSVQVLRKLGDLI